MVEGVLRLDVLKTRKVSRFSVHTGVLLTCYVVGIEDMNASDGGTRTGEEGEGSSEEFMSVEAVDEGKRSTRSKRRLTRSGA